MSNPALVFDIETVGDEFDELDEYSKEYFEKYFRQYTETQEEVLQAKDRLGFWPLTGAIVAIGFLNPQTQRGAVYLNCTQTLPQELEEGISLVSGTEEEIIKKFWEAASHYDHFITFNGRSFDAPFLMIRSAILGVTPSKNLMANRYLSSQPSRAMHIDLLDQLTFYGAARKKFPLHLWTKAFGIKSPKESGVTGDDVKRLWRDGKFLDIARYNIGDVRATNELYERWKTYLSF